MQELPVTKRKVGPNEKCPCGSGIKYKKCYEKGVGCKLLEEDNRKDLLTTHAQKEKDVTEFLMEAVADSNSLFPKKDTEPDFVSIRVQLIICFSLIDVFASYWYEYVDIQTTQSARFNGWLERFCFNDLNNEYKKERFGDLDIDLLLKLRNSLVHFFAIPNGTNPGIVLTPNDFSDETIKEHMRKFKNKGNNVLYLKPIWIKRLLVSGAKLMLEGMIKNITLAKSDDSKGWDHINGIDRIHKKTQLEGAKRIDVKKYDEEIGAPD